MTARESTRYTVLFAAAVCVVCALLVSVAAVLLQPRQQANALQYQQKNVLLAAGLVEPGDALAPAELRRIFESRIEVRLVDLEAGTLLTAGALDAAHYDAAKARNDPAASRPAPSNRAGIVRLPQYGVVHLVKSGGQVQQVVLSVEGVGMWGWIRGFIALAPDGNTVQGLAFYEQRETPGLGGEIANPSWQALWHGRKGYDAQWQPRLHVAKGDVGSPQEDPYRVDALSGATITSNAVTRIVQFWLSDDGFGHWLKSFRQGGAT